MLALAMFGSIGSEDLSGLSTYQWPKAISFGVCQTLAISVRATYSNCFI